MWLPLPGVLWHYTDCPVRPECRLRHGGLAVAPLWRVIADRPAQPAQTVVCSCIPCRCDATRLPQSLARPERQRVSGFPDRRPGLPHSAVATCELSRVGL